MAHRYRQPVQVWRVAEAPAGFVWRRRRYLVHGLLDHWVRAGGWWRTDPPAGAGAGPDDADREFWRVVAQPPSSPIGVYDLCLDWSTGSWTVVRVLD